MSIFAEALGSKCLQLDDKAVKETWNEDVINTLRISASSFRNHPGYGYAMAYFFGRVSFFRKRYTNSLFFFRMAEALATTSPVLNPIRRQLELDLICIGQATSLFQKKQYATALESLSKAYNTEHPELAGRFYGEVGWNHLRLESFDRAEEAFGHSLEASPGNKYAINGYGNALHGKGDYAGARSKHLAALKIDNTFAHAWCDLGHANLKLGRFQHALVCFDTAQKFNLHSAHWYEGAGETLKALGKHEEGQQLVDHAEFEKNGKPSGKGVAAALEILSDLAAAVSERKV